MRRQTMMRSFVIGAVFLAGAIGPGCGSYDHKEEFNKVQQRLECWGSGDCTWEEEGHTCITQLPGTSTPITLFCSSCKVVTAEAVGKYEKPGCKPDAGAGGSTGGNAGEAGAGGTPPCTPGQQINCGCPGGFQGTQICTAQGVYGLCDCDAGAGGATGGSAGNAGEAGSAGNGGAGGAGGTTTGGSAGEAGNAGQAGTAGEAGSAGNGGAGGTSNGGSAGEAGAAGTAGEAGAAGQAGQGGTAQGGAGGSGGATGGSAGAAGEAGADGEAGAAGSATDAGTCNSSSLPASCTTVLGTACANKFEDAPNCNGLVRCGCTNMWVLTCAAENFTCSCHGGDLCSNWGWSEGYTCTELDPGSDGGTRTLTCQCNVMLDEPVICVNPPPGTGGSSGAGGAGGTSQGGSAGNAGEAGAAGNGGAGGTSNGGSGGTSTGGSATGGSGGSVPDASTSLNNPEFLTKSCTQSEVATSLTAPPASGLVLEHRVPIKLPDTLLGEYDWTDYSTPGYKDTDWQIRTATSSTAYTSIFTLLVIVPGLEYDRWFVVKQIDPYSAQNCLYYNDDGYYSNFTTDKTQTSSLYHTGVWVLWYNGVQIATYTDAAGVTTPPLPFKKTYTLDNGAWAVNIGVHLPLPN